MPSSRKAFDPAKTAIVLAVGGVSAALILVIGVTFGPGDLDSAAGEALSSLVTLAATSIVVVFLIDWHRRAQWERAEMEDLRSILLLSSLIASGSESPTDFRPADFDLPQAKARLDDEIGRLQELSEKLDGIVKETEDKSELYVVFAAPWGSTNLAGYYRAGARPRRLSYLATLVETHLPGLVERYDEPRLFAKFVDFRYAVMAAAAAARDTEEQIRIRILMDRPEVLRPFLSEHPDSFVIDPVSLLVQAGRSIVEKYENPETMRTRLEAHADADATAWHLDFIPHCFGAVANEISAIQRALEALKDLLEHEHLEADILLAEAAAKEPVTGPGVS
jgi:hypothetical protein